MPGVENYQKNPEKKLVRVLAACEWEQVGDGLWEKGESRLYVDNIGCFLYRILTGQWIRAAGCSHNRVRHLKERRIKFDDFNINLLTGD